MSKIKNWEQIDDYMQDGYKFYMKNDSVSACKKTGEQITKSEAEKILTETKEAFAWLLTLKPQNE